jgi:acetylornithine deacetylase/succinyl-diaminopimelate desuccinylase-like protein
MGSLNFTITLVSNLGGKHTTYVPFGQNPIRYLGDLIGRITDYQQEMDSDGEKYGCHRLAGTERIDLGIVQAGDYYNRTPGRCTLTGTRRWNPGRTAAEVLAELEALAAPIAAAGNLDLQVEMVHEREPFETPDDDAAVRATAEAHRRVTGQTAAITGKRIVGDANLYVNFGHRPAYYYGPSNDTAHSDQEWVSIERLAQAAKVYALTALLYCGVAG